MTEPSEEAGGRGLPVTPAATVRPATTLPTSRPTNQPTNQPTGLMREVAR
jgi:hypothetical protein